MMSTPTGPLYRKVRGELDNERGSNAEEIIVVAPNSIKKFLPIILFGLLLVIVVMATGYGQVLDALQGTSALIRNTVSTSSAVTVSTGTQVEPLKTLQSQPRLIAKVPDEKGGIFEVYDEPIPEGCVADQHADFDGVAVQWGLGHKARSAAECCRRCLDFKGQNGVKMPCNVWVWCGDPSGRCWTMDIHKHTTGDCWLKYQKDWDNVTDFTKTNLVVNFRGHFSFTFREEHKTAPDLVPWTAGVAKPSVKGKL